MLICIIKLTTVFIIVYYQFGRFEIKITYFTGLNGLRSICALAVVISHTTLALSSFNLDPFILGHQADGAPKSLDLAGFGVTIFFVISGFLITYLLQVESVARQHIDIKKFYYRRILRIWPLYYAYLILSLLTIYFYNLHYNAHSLSYYTFFMANVPFIIGGTLPFLAHYWSLGVEEQFYLFWPVLNKYIKFNIYIIEIFALSLIILKLLLHFLFPHSIVEQFISVTRFDCMMIGALGSIWYKHNNEWFLRITDNVLTQCLCWIVIFMCAINKFHIASIIDNEIIALVGLCLIIGQINGTNRIFNLESRIFNFLGRISYGIYVIHPLVIFYIAKLIKNLTVPDNIKYLLAYVSVMTITIMLSSISFNYFEKYFLKMKSKYVVVASRT